jgi:hypothetical protein
MTDAEICRVISKHLDICEGADFFGDPHYRDVLQAKLLEDGFMITMAWLPDRQIGKLKRTNCASMHLGKGIGSGEREFHIYDTRERIWALAYIRAHNLTADRLEG